MNKKIYLFPIIISLIIVFCLVTGCGDDGTQSLSIQGPTGPAGEIGATGATGDTGPAEFGSLTIEVDLADGSPLSGYVATLIRQSNTPETTEDVETSATPDADGIYTFSYVVPGDYKLIIEAEGYCPQTRELTVAPGEDKTLTGDNSVTVVRGLYGSTGFGNLYLTSSYFTGSQTPSSSVYLINCNTGESTFINTVNYVIIAMDFLPGSSPEAIYAVAADFNFQSSSIENDLTASGPLPYYFDPNSLVLLQMDGGANVTNVTDLRYTGGVPLSTSDSISDVSFDSNGQFYIFLERDWFDPNDPNEPDCIVPVDISTGIISDPNTAVSAPGDDTQYNSMAFTSDSFSYIRGIPLYPGFTSTLYASPQNLSPFSTINSSIEYLFWGMDYREADSNMFASAININNNSPFLNSLLVSIDIQTGEITPRGSFREVSTDNPLAIYSIAAPLTQQLP